jgi:hypothetical protein
VHGHVQGAATDRPGGPPSGSPVGVRADYNTFRDHLVLEFEVRKTDGDLGNPDVYVPLDTRTVDRKVRLLEGCFDTRRDKRSFSEDAFRVLVRLLGIEACPRAVTPRRSTAGEPSSAVGMR